MEQHGDALLRVRECQSDFLSEELRAHVEQRALPVDGVPGLLVERDLHTSIPAADFPADAHTFESRDAMAFVVGALEAVAPALAAVLEARAADRAWIDAATPGLARSNAALRRQPNDADFESVVGRPGREGRVVVGPTNVTAAAAADAIAKDPGSGGVTPEEAVAAGASWFTEPRGAPVAPLPPHLQGPHVTLFGPPSSRGMAINAMNSLYRVLPDEPAEVTRLVEESGVVPKWGADDEDSTTPLLGNLEAAMSNLSACFRGTLRDAAKALAKAGRAHPYKRIPGLALPSTAFLYRGTPVPLHVLDFALHVFWLWDIPEALTFYVPKLENDEEAAYLAHLIRVVEDMVKAAHPTYVLGTVRVLCVLESARAVFRINEIITALHPYFAGASLGWHDYLASAARLFREDPSYRIPVKADPYIVVRHMRESHVLLSRVVRGRGGLAIGGMYGILPVSRELAHPSMQSTLQGYIQDVVIQMKRGLDGFWVAHPDFVRIGIALVEAYRQDTGAAFGNGKPPGTHSAVPADGALVRLVRALLVDAKAADTAVQHVTGADPAPSLKAADPAYPRALLAAELGGVSTPGVLPNHHPEEVRYNVFQALQYLADWLAGNGCVALPAHVRGAEVRVMDDLATTERSRWEVWHEVRHGRFPLASLLAIVNEEMAFIRRHSPGGAAPPGGGRGDKRVAVAWGPRTARWYPVARRVLVRLATDAAPAEFATELLMAFTLPSVRAAADPWAAAAALAPAAFFAPPVAEAFDAAWQVVPAASFADAVARAPAVSKRAAALRALAALSPAELAGAMEHAHCSDSYSSAPSSAPPASSASTSAASAARARGLFAERIDAAWPAGAPAEVDVGALAARWGVSGASLAILHAPPQAATKPRRPIDITIRAEATGRGDAGRQPLTTTALMQIASLSKPIATAFAIDYFEKHGIALETPLNDVLQKTGSRFRLKAAAGCPSEWADAFQLLHLFTLTGLGQHYVFGFEASAEKPLPDPVDLLEGRYESVGYKPVVVEKEPDTRFGYSGGALVVLHHVLEAHSNQPLHALLGPWLATVAAPGDLVVCDPAGVPYGAAATDRLVATGFADDGAPYPRLCFPPLAAGLLGTPTGVAEFLAHLVRAFRDPHAEAPISHRAAVLMLAKRAPMGSREFMGCDTGLGMFVAECGPNRVMLHQAANEGFRGVFAAVFDGPDAGSGFVILSQADESGVLFNVDAARTLLAGMAWQGLAPLDTLPPMTAFSSQGIDRASIVNQAYRKLLFAAFTPDLSEVHPAAPGAGPHALAAYDVCQGAELVAASRQCFAPAINLVRPTRPHFDPAAFGSHGKIMDSWETARHNHLSHDWAVFRLRDTAEGVPPHVHLVEFSTEYHDGNHAPGAALEGSEDGDPATATWHSLVPDSPLEGHASHRFVCPPATADMRFRLLRVRMRADGGISRLRCYDRGTLPRAEAARYPCPTERFTTEIASVVRVTTLGGGAEEAATAGRPEKVRANWARTVAAGGVDGSSYVQADVASASLGASVEACSNQHYGPATAVVAASVPRGMFDGFETRRARAPGAADWVVVRLAATVAVDAVELDMTYFVHNNPKHVTVEGGDSPEGPWHVLVPRTLSKPFAGNTMVVRPAPPVRPVAFLRIVCAPCGGFNRVRAHARVPRALAESKATASNL